MSPYNDRLILDRWAPISDRIYGRLLRNGSAFDDHPEAELLDRIWRFTPTLVIYCRPPDDHIFNTSKPEMAGVKENALDLLITYDNLMHEIADIKGDTPESFGMSAVWVYDYTVDNLDMFTERVQQWQSMTLT